MDERDWQILYALYSEHNITRAAQNLFISQPTLTKRLKQIENELGVKIVNRGVKGVVFTPQGEYLAKKAAEMLTFYTRIREEVLNLQDEVAGTLRIGASNSFARYLLPGILRDFKERYPRVEFQVNTGISRSVFNSVFNQEVHIALLRGDYTWREQKQLLFEENICVASKSKIDLADLPKLPRIHYETDYAYKSLLEDWWSEHYSQPPLINMLVDRGDTCKQMVLNGLGYAFFPELYLQNDSQLHRIYLFDKQGNPLKRRTWMYYQKDSLEINVVRAFVHFIENYPFPSSIRNGQLLPAERE
ncbi:LysR family transcriptional regulator [Brevibacillus marinus]|uniref:LysR family transcriptional regulator n=1 Tax=Brevibacillus marinus TaxID=2496837 RepID=UPI000F845F18|nr:LysR family transcriptional regulator [Brevibacillus marinus]